MKPLFHRLLTLMALVPAPSLADVVYSNFLNTAIPLNFDGVTIQIGSGELNPFFGGFALANDADIQPFRMGSGGLDTIRNFSTGASIDLNSTHVAIGSGGSQDHIGMTFTAGQEGYVGFKLDGNKVGWMRVTFTNNTSGAKIHDWSYDDNGSAIAVGGIRQLGQEITINANMTLRNSLMDSGGATHLVLGNSATATLSSNQLYSGNTTVQSGATLNLIGNIVSTAQMTVHSNARLGGTGTVSGSAIINGIHSPGIATVNAGVGAQAFGGSVTYGSSSVFEWDIHQSSTSSGFDTVAANSGIIISEGATMNLESAVGVEFRLQGGSCGG